MKTVGCKNKNRKKESGQAMVEFAIVFPVLFFFFLTIIQMGLLYTAKQIVNYAAFYAARSAIVMIPEKDIDTGTKREMIERAASIACIPISPRFSHNARNYLIYKYPVQLTNLYLQIVRKCPELLFVGFDLKELPGIDFVNHVAGLDIAGLLRKNLDLTLSFELLGRLSSKPGIGERYAMSRILTMVDIIDTESKRELHSLDSYKAHKDITVNIKYHYVLRVPVVNKIFNFMYIHYFLTKEISDSISGEVPQSVIHRISSQLDSALEDLSRSHDLQYYILPIKGSCTLQVEGDVDNKKNCNRRFWM